MHINPSFYTGQSGEDAAEDDSVLAVDQGVAGFERSILLEPPGAVDYAFPRTLAGGVGLTPTSGRLYAGGYVASPGRTVTKIAMWKGSSSVGLTHSWVAIYDKNLHKIAVSNDNTAEWLNAVEREFTLNNPLVITEPTLYYYVFCVVATTPGTFAGQSGSGTLMAGPPYWAFHHAVALFTTPATAPDTLVPATATALRVYASMRGTIN